LPTKLFLFSFTYEYSELIRRWDRSEYATTCYVYLHVVMEVYKPHTVYIMIILCMMS